MRRRPLNPQYLVQKQMVRKLFEWRPTTPTAHRLAGGGEGRTPEGERGGKLLQVCDLWWDHSFGYGAPGFEGTCSLHIVRRKIDTQRKGVVRRALLRHLRTQGWYLRGD